MSGLKTAKHDGYAGLSTDYVIYACDELFVHIALLFSAMLVHGIVFDDLTTSSIIPIPKGKNMNCTESCNYRGIALSSIFGKLIDQIILSRYADKLITSQHQFGFKKSHSTIVCTMVVKETINYYTVNKGHVFCTFLDATKAFDRVKYCKLFKCLIDRKLPCVVLRLLYKLYPNHFTRVIWNGVQSSWFKVVNGVKQGGVLSPLLFCEYIDGLLSAVSAAKVGCSIGTMFTGILAYADDIALLAPTAYAMRRMLSFCESYAADFCVSFNASKSKCVLFTSLCKLTEMEYLHGAHSSQLMVMLLNLYRAGLT